MLVDVEYHVVSSHSHVGLGLNNFVLAASVEIGTVPSSDMKVTATMYHTRG